MISIVKRLSTSITKNVSEEKSPIAPLKRLDGFVSSQDINWWTGVVWIIVMFLAAVWTLSLTAPIHCRGSDGEQVM